MNIHNFLDTAQLYNWRAASNMKTRQLNCLASKINVHSVTNYSTNEYL